MMMAMAPNDTALTTSTNFVNVINYTCGSSTTPVPGWGWNSSYCWMDNSWGEIQRRCWEWLRRWMVGNIDLSGAPMRGRPRNPPITPRVRYPREMLRRKLLVSGDRAMRRRIRKLMRKIH